LSLSSVISLTVFFPCTAHTTPPPSFPTRRSSDLGAPAQVLRFELGSDRLGLSRVHAAVAEHLPGGAGAAGGDGRIGRAVRSRFGGRALTADERDLVGQLLVRDRVVANQQLALLLERLREVGRLRFGAEQGR